MFFSYVVVMLKLCQFGAIKEIFFIEVCHILLTEMLLKLCPFSMKERMSNLNKQSKKHFMQSQVSG